LASGSRINHAADDAAGLAISENIRAQVRSIRQDVRNANDGISMIQTAEGGMNEISNILVRFRELSIQGASDTITDREREFIDKEVQQLSSEVDRIANSTEFNGRKLLAGSKDSGVLDIQVGMNNDPMLDRFQYDPSKTDVTKEALGLSDFNIKTKEAAQNNLAKIDEAMNRINGARAELGAFQNRLQSTVSNLQVYDENLSAARSQIADVDIAAETATHLKNQILTQSGIAVLSQANQSGSQALRLLG
jgi:flagellin